MYVPEHFEPPSAEALHALMAEHPFATLVTHGAEGLCANHLPMQRYLPENQPQGVLVGHIARANPLWRQVSNGDEVLVIFQGPQAYITPSWYPSKAETGKAVPTWNYAVVHAHGRIRVVDDPQWVKEHIEKLTQQQEAAFAHPWAVSDAPKDYTEKLLAAVVGIEVVIDKLVGKWKVSQNRPTADQAGVVAGLQRLGVTQAAQMAALVASGTG